MLIKLLLKYESLQVSLRKKHFEKHSLCTMARASNNYRFKKDFENLVINNRFTFYKRREE